MSIPTHANVLFYRQKVEQRSKSYIEDAWSSNDPQSLDLHHHQHVTCWLRIRIRGKSCSSVSLPHSMI